MSTRILVTLDEDADPDAVVRALYEAGAESVTPPQPELPDVAIATFADGGSEPSIATIQTIKGVSVAEPDAWRDASADSGGESEGDFSDLGIDMGIEPGVESGGERGVESGVQDGAEARGRLRRSGPGTDS